MPIKILMKFTYVLIALIANHLGVQTLFTDVLFEDLVVHVSPSLLYFASVRTKIKFLGRTIFLQMIYHLRVVELFLFDLLDLVFLFLLFLASTAYSITIVVVLASVLEDELAKSHFFQRAVHGFWISSMIQIC